MKSIFYYFIFSYFHQIMIDNFLFWLQKKHNFQSIPYIESELFPFPLYFINNNKHTSSLGPYDFFLVPIQYSLVLQKNKEELFSFNSIIIFLWSSILFFSINRFCHCLLLQFDVRFHKWIFFLFLLSILFEKW